jgi:hypothetical protein
VAEDGAMKPTRILIALAALSLAAAPAAVGAAKKPPSPVKKNVTYSGSTSQKQVCRVGSSEGQLCVVIFNTSKDGKSIPLLQMYWRAGPCSDRADRYHRGATNFTKLPISSNRFSTGATTYKTTFADGTSATITVTLNGKFKRSSTGKYSASGDFTAKSDLVFTDGGTSHCETGKVTWKAKPGK